MNIPQVFKNGFESSSAVSNFFANTSTAAKESNSVLKEPSAFDQSFEKQLQQDRQDRGRESVQEDYMSAQRQRQDQLRQDQVNRDQRNQDRLDQANDRRREADDARNAEIKDAQDRELSAQAQRDEGEGENESVEVSAINPVLTLNAANPPVEKVNEVVEDLTVEDAVAMISEAEALAISKELAAAALAKAKQAGVSVDDLVDKLQEVKDVVPVPRPGEGKENEARVQEALAQAKSRAGDIDDKMHSELKQIREERIQDKENRANKVEASTQRVVDVVDEATEAEGKVKQAGGKLEGRLDKLEDVERQKDRAHEEVKTFLAENRAKVRDDEFANILDPVRAKQVWAQETYAEQNGSLGDDLALSSLGERSLRKAMSNESLRQSAQLAREYIEDPARRLAELAHRDHPETVEKIVNYKLNAASGEASSQDLGTWDAPLKDMVKSNPPSALKTVFTQQPEDIKPSASEYIRRELDAVAKPTVAVNDRTAYTHLQDSDATFVWEKPVAAVAARVSSGQNNTPSSSNDSSNASPSNRAAAAVVEASSGQGSMGSDVGQEGGQQSFQFAKQAAQVMENLAGTGAEKSLPAQLAPQIVKQIERLRETGQSWMRVSLGEFDGKDLLLHVRMDRDEVQVRMHSDSDTVTEDLESGWADLQAYAHGKGIRLVNADIIRQPAEAIFQS